MKRFFILTLVVFFSLGIFAQNNPKARAIIDRAATLLQKSGVKVEFSMIVEDLKATKKQTVKGDLWMKGSKFKLKVADVETFFDGKTQWVYMPKNKEVSVANPDAQELQDINPTLILSGYSKKGIVQFSQGNKADAPTQSIDIFPENKKKPFFKITVVLDTKSWQLLSIKMYGRNAVNTTMQVNKYQSGVNIDDAMFVFDSKKYTGVNVNDLR